MKIPDELGYSSCSVTKRAGNCPFIVKGQQLSCESIIIERPEIGQGKDMIPFAPMKGTENNELFLRG